MIDDSGIGIYEYVESIMESVTENVYLMNEPQELTTSDTEEGFIVILVGDFVDASEFKGNAYAAARVFVQCYIPPITRGRLNKELYKKFEDDVNAAIALASTSDNTGKYWIDEESFISADMGEDDNANNAYYMFVKSFVVMVGDEGQ